MQPASPLPRVVVAAMFHRSAGDHERQWHSRTLGYDSQRGGVGSLLSHDARVEALPTPPEHAARRDNVRETFQATGAAAPPVDSLAQFGRRGAGEIAQKARARGSEMDLAMHGIGAIEKPRRAPPPAHQQGSQMQALMSGESPPPGAALDDPFAHVRGGGRHRPAAQAYPTDPLALINADLGLSALDRQATNPAAPQPCHDSNDLVRSVNEAYDALMRAVTSAPREADGSFSDYTFVFDILQRHGFQLGTEGAGNLIASCDVQGGISFSEFLQCLGLAPPSRSDHAGIDTSQQAQEQQLSAAATAKAPLTWTAGGNFREEGPSQVQMPASSGTLRDLVRVPGGVSGANLELGRLLNGDLNRNARRSNLVREAEEHSPPARSTGGRIF